jgi:glycosyltransferase
MSLRISVITAVYNRVDTIADALDSVRAQTWPHVEHVVIDGASKDGTTQLLEARKDTLDVFISERDKGIYDALNKGIANATGDIVGFLHADDLFASNDILAKVAKLFEDPSVGAVYGDLVYVKKEDVSKVVRYWKSGAFSKAKLARGWMPPHPTLYLRRSIYQELGGFDTQFRIAADYDSMLRYLGKGGVRPAYLPEVMVRMRLGGESNRSLANVIKKSKEDYLALKKNGVGGLPTLTAKNLRKLPQFLAKAAK